MGALFFTGIGIRHSQDVSPIAYGFRRHIEFHISNVQIIDLHYIDPANAKEIFGKYDILQNLLQSRERVQMVDTNNYGIWVVDGKERLKKYGKNNNPRAWNMHAGTKIQSTNVMALATSVARILNFAR